MKFEHDQIAYLHVKWNLWREFHSFRHWHRFCPFEKLWQWVFWSHTSSRFWRFKHEWYDQTFFDQAVFSNEFFSYLAYAFRWIVLFLPRDQDHEINFDTNDALFEAIDFVHVHRKFHVIMSHDDLKSNDIDELDDNAIYWHWYISSVNDSMKIASLFFFARHKWFRFQNENFNFSQSNDLRRQKLKWNNDN